MSLKTLTTSNITPNVYVINLPHKQALLTRFLKLSAEAGVNNAKVYKAIVGNDLDMQHC